MSKLKIDITFLNENAVIPTRGSDEAAGYDLRAVSDDGYMITIPPHETVKIHTGIAIKIPDGYFGAIFARSGIATKRGLRPANCVGVIDSDYTGEVIVALHNDTDEYMSVDDGERVAQLVVLPYMKLEFCIKEHLDETERGSGGFGSTDINEIRGDYVVS